MIKSIRLLECGFESSSQTTEEFKLFFKTFKSEFTKELKKVGATEIKFSMGHFFVFGFFTIGSQAWYFSISDVRGSDYMMPYLLYRTAKDYKDYTGGSNKTVDIEIGMGENMRLFG